MTAEIFDARTCTLGEGPLWHPEREELFWFDILGHRLHSKAKTWEFDRCVSAAGWVDADRLLIACEFGLSIFDLGTGTDIRMRDLEADRPETRSNDGRADPWGGFWIGTMGKKLEPKLGAIYRFHDAKIEKLFDHISIPNAICFAPDRSCAYFTDTPTRQIMRQALDDSGWPKGKPEVFVDLNADGLNPDGAVTDAEGTLWVAQWGASRVAGYDNKGTFIGELKVSASQASCPALAPGEMYITTAAEGLAEPDGGKTFVVPSSAPFKPEPRVQL